MIQLTEARGRAGTRQALQGVPSLPSLFLALFYAQYTNWRLQSSTLATVFIFAALGVIHVVVDVVVYPHMMSPLTMSRV